MTTRNLVEQYLYDPIKIGRPVNARILRESWGYTEEGDVFETDEDLFADEDEDEEEFETAQPDEDDIYIDMGSRGSTYTVSAAGDYLGEFSSIEAAEQAIKEWMSDNSFYPSIWWVSDHGNIHPYTLESTAA